MIEVNTFYKFFPIEKNSLKGIKTKIEDRALALEIRGLVLLAEEGINATVAGQKEALKNFLNEIESLFKEKFFYKHSKCENWNFKMFSVKIKDEIINVGFKDPHLKQNNNHLSPKDWEDRLSKDVQIIDIRNDYEVEIGKFKQAQNLKIENFKDFPNKLDGLLDEKKVDKSKDSLIYCTGGIRCEKAIEIMKGKGFKKIYQLEGGIINYLKEYPNSYFEGECFVFDHRVSLNQTLKASKKYKLCPHCGQPGEQTINCNHCQKEAVVCQKCLDKSKHYKTCSKNCNYHFVKGHQCLKPISKPKGLPISKKKLLIHRQT